MKKGWALFLGLTLTICIQGECADSTGTGIRFESGLRWQNVINKAKAESKFIFVDCFTTWCLPCKRMEHDVYPQKKVGDFFNEKFVSIKLQMDTTVRDNEDVKSLYGDAKDIKVKYAVNGFPTYLIFTSDGKLLYRFTGMQEADAFVKISADAINPERNYYNFLQEYKSGIKDYSRMALMARIAMTLKDSANGYIMAGDFIKHLKKPEYLTIPSIELFREFTKSTKDLGFKFIYQNPHIVNKVVKDDDFSQEFIQTIIYKEYVTNVLANAAKSGNSPGWASLQRLLEKQFGSYYADRVIISAKLKWYRKYNNFNMYTKYLVIYFDRFEFRKDRLFRESGESIEDLVLNNYAWEVFKYSNNDDELKKALIWSNRAVGMNPTGNWMDTYSNLLYKLGQKELAIKWEEVAMKTEPTNVDIKLNLAKMKDGNPTWPEVK